MPPKKKNPKNAFWFFAMDWKLDKEQGGQRFSNMKEVMDLCSSDWQHLPEHIKAFYKKKEKEAKKRSKEDTSGKYNSLGISFDEIDKKKGEEEMAHEKMCDFIDTTIKSISVNVDTLKKHYFYLVHVNSYCYWEAQNVYIPCEVAISKFNIQDGVVDVYHVFPSPLTENGDIPTGYRYQATSSTEKVHSIPCPKDWDRTEFDWDKIRVDIFKFLRPNRDDAIPPVYTLNEGTNLNCEMQAVSDFFELLTDGSDVEFLVYSLPKLFHKLYLSCYNMASELFKGQINVNSAFPVEGVAHAQLIKDIYNFSPGIACSFHEGTNHYQNCSLSFVRRWVYLICEFCCNVLKVSLVPGRHCIHNADIAHQELSQPKPPSKPSSQKNERRDNTASELHYGMKNLSLPDKTSTNDGWTPVPGPQKTRKTSSRDSEELLLIDHSKVPDPALTRVLKSGQSPHVVSEVMPSTSVRLPTSRGRGELMAEMLRQQSPGASFSSNDFPGLGESRPGRADKPTPAGWGRGFSK